MNRNALREKLETLYRKYNKREFIHPDPLEFLYLYDDIRDREIVGLLASSLAYGRVAQINLSVEKALTRMKNSPRDFVLNSSEKEIIKSFCGFKHRFTTGEELAGMFIGAKHAIERFGSLNDCFLAGYYHDHETVMPAISEFGASIGFCNENICKFLLPRPSAGSACKRLNLYLKWLVRKDDVDPGGWKGISKSKLIIPLDVHMFRIGANLGLTERKQANLKTAIEITEAFKKISPDDPTKYDFVLTRFGIRSDFDEREIYSK